MRNKCIQAKFGVAPIEEKMMETSQRWLGHVRRPIQARMRKVNQMEDSPIQGV